MPRPVSIQPFAALALALATALVGAPREARAGGYFIGDIGARGMGRGGAFIAAPDSLLAMHYNPAGLSQLQGLHVEIDAALSNLDLTYQRSCPCVDPSLSNAQMLDQQLMASFQGHPAHTATPLAIPFISVGYGFPVLDLTVAVALFGPYAGAYEYGSLPPTSAVNFEQAARNAPQRYSAISSEAIDPNFVFSFGMKPIEPLPLRVGGSLMFYRSETTERIHLWLNSATFGTSPEDPRLDVPITAHFVRPIGVNWALGASLELFPGLSVGGSFEAKRSIRANGTLDIQLPKLLMDLGAKVNGRDVQSELNETPVTRLGVEYRMPELFTAEASFVYEDWSVFDQFVVRPQNITFTLMDQSQQIPKIVIPRHWKGTYSVRAGGELHIFEPWLTARAGYFFEPSAVPTTYLDATRVDLDKHGLSIGAGTTFYGVRIDASVMYVIVPSKTVTDSMQTNVQVVSPPIGSPQYITVLGNGTYDASYLVGVISASMALDPLMKAIE